ncbi:hypothetical protein AVEN_48352-1 [Araneus ventricosus]|uniref:Uncharacterized protein n=1 Tax=Araneus ventricosus TaxID=182803 RepID=A0A4Y2VNF3_ARAVE|nr:hypothetical protein AVEN_216985-1 [Araneus ventricosus]GBO25936.1 hypothetical protein AVEN_35338-1 [Araneus ventricosus]GBO25937.1 hypothetical protein AVEN_200734-1 [Araneus ventricosus]GBO25938.1 hypothetical protein AVEN_48352-1 [Araneus ventricosus]
MKSFLSLQKFQEDDIQVWAVNCQQRKELLFSRKIDSGARNRLSQASIEWGGLRRDRAHRVNALKPDVFLTLWFWFFDSLGFLSSPAETRASFISKVAFCY